MDKKQRDYIENCVEKNISGKHKYFTNEDGKQECKHCGLLKSTVDGIKKEREKKEDLEVSPYSLEEINQGLSVNKKEIGKEIFDKILEQTNSKSAVIITFGDTVLGEDKKIIKINGFHINSVNIKGKYLKFLFDMLAKALNGELGGKLNMKQTDI